MPIGKSAKQRMQDEVDKALAEGNVALANEITANVMVGTTLLIVFAVMLICLILNEFDVFSADKTLMHWAVLIGAVIEVPITVLNSIYVGNKPWLKIPLMVDLVLVCAVFSAVMGHNVVLAMVFPIVVSTRYFDLKYTQWVAVITLFIFALSTLFNGFFGIVNLNMVKFAEDMNLVIPQGTSLRDAILSSGYTRAEYIKSLFVNDFAPRATIFICLAFSCSFVASRGKNMVDLQSTTVKKASRIETELDLATKIQTSMLPCIFPAFPEHQNVELRTIYHPAKEVSGDFYDYFDIDSTHVGMLIADVSGKGIGAALFMMIAKTVLKNQLQLGISPAQALTNSNRQLCEGNEAGIFVTCWAGVYDIETGVLTFVNAGHNPPVILRKGKKAEFIKQQRGFVLAGMDGFKYKQEEIKLSPDDAMFFYTDGVTEATNKDSELFGDDRLLKCLDTCQGADTKGILDTVRENVINFVGEAEQFDDITVMALKILE